MSIKKSLESSFSLTLALYAAFFISFVYSVILVRIVSVEAMGMIGMGGTFIEITALVSTLGSISIIQTYTTYYLSRDEYGHLKYILKRMSGISLAIAGAISAATFLFSSEISLALYNTELMSLPLKVVAVFIVANIVLKILETVVRASKQFTLYGTVQIMSTALKLILTLLFIYLLLSNVSGEDDVIVAGSFLASIAVTLVCIAVILSRNRSGIRKVMDAETEKPVKEKFLKFGASTASLELISMWGVYINSLAIGFFLPPEEWGYYTIAVIIMSVVTVFKTVLNVIAYPAMVDAHSKGDSREFNLTIHIMFKYWTLFFVPLVAAFILFLPYALPVIWGTAYNKSILIAQILLVGFVIQYYSSIYSSALTAVEKPHKQFIPTVINVTLNVCLGIALVSYFGILGAAITVLVSNAVSFFVSRYYFIREQADVEPSARKGFAREMVTVLAIELIIVFALFIPAWFMLGYFTDMNVQFVLALVMGIAVSLASVSYVFGRRKFSDEETARILELFPGVIRPMMERMQKISVTMWHG